MKVNKINNSKCYIIALNENEIKDLNLALTCAQILSNILMPKIKNRFEEYSNQINEGMKNE